MVEVLQEFHSLFDLSSYMSEPQSGGVYTEILMTL